MKNLSNVPIRSLFCLSMIIMNTSRISSSIASTTLYMSTVIVWNKALASLLLSKDRTVPAVNNAAGMTTHITVIGWLRGECINLRKYVISSGMMLGPASIPVMVAMVSIEEPLSSTTWQASEYIYNPHAVNRAMNRWKVSVLDAIIMWMITQNRQAATDVKKYSESIRSRRCFRKWMSPSRLLPGQK